MGVESVIWHEAESYMSMPQQRPGKSKQDYGTPWDLIRAVEGRWGKIGLDLAAHDDGRNAKAPLWLSPAWSYLEHSLKSLGLDQETLAWCNPPFENIGPWARKWKADSEETGQPLISLVPASVGSNWFIDDIWVATNAQIVPLSPRLCFQGCHVLNKDGEPKCGGDAVCDGCATYPKDCMLVLYNLPAVSHDGHRVEPWRWK